MVTAEGKDIDRLLNHLYLHAQLSLRRARGLVAYLTKN